MKLSLQKSMTFSHWFFFNYQNKIKLLDLMTLEFMTFGLVTYNSVTLDLVTFEDLKLRRIMTTEHDLEFWSSFLAVTGAQIKDSNQCFCHILLSSSFLINFRRWMNFEVNYFRLNTIINVKPSHIHRMNPMENSFIAYEIHRNICI